MLPLHTPHCWHDALQPELFFGLSIGLFGDKCCPNEVETECKNWTCTFGDIVEKSDLQLRHMDLCLSSNFSRGWIVLYLSVIRTPAIVCVAAVDAAWWGVALVASGGIVDPDYNGELNGETVGWNGGILFPWGKGSYILWPTSFSVDTMMFASCFKSDQLRLALLVESINFLKISRIETWH